MQWQVFFSKPSLGKASVTVFFKIHRQNIKKSWIFPEFSGFLVFLVLFFRCQTFLSVIY